MPDPRRCPQPSLIIEAAITPSASASVRISWRNPLPNAMIGADTITRHVHTVPSATKGENGASPDGPGLNQVQHGQNPNSDQSPRRSSSEGPYGGAHSTATGPVAA